jgi:hypothetical protein
VVGSVDLKGHLPSALIVPVDWDRLVLAVGRLLAASHVRKRRTLAAGEALGSPVRLAHGLPDGIFAEYGL